MNAPDTAPYSDWASYFHRLNLASDGGSLSPGRVWLCAVCYPLISQIAS